MMAIDVGSGCIALVDDEDYERASAFAWHVREDGYVQRTWTRDGKVFHDLLHRFVMNANPEDIVDHENNDRWDCRKENLRVATLSQNAANRSFAGPWKGIFRHGDKWKARIKIDQKNIYLGCFNTPEEAAFAYDMAAKKLFGEFARVNFT